MLDASIADASEGIPVEDVKRALTPVEVPAKDGE